MKIYLLEFGFYSKYGIVDACILATSRYRLIRKFIEYEYADQLDHSRRDLWTKFKNDISEEEFINKSFAYMDIS